MAGLRGLRVRGTGLQSPVQPQPDLTRGRDSPASGACCQHCPGACQTRRLPASPGVDLDAHFSEISGAL